MFNSYVKLPESMSIISRSVLLLFPKYQGRWFIPKKSCGPADQVWLISKTFSVHHGKAENFVNGYIMLYLQKDVENPLFVDNVPRKIMDFHIYVGSRLGAQLTICLLFHPANTQIQTPALMVYIISYNSACCIISKDSMVNTCWSTNLPCGKLG